MIILVPMSPGGCEYLDKFIQVKHLWEGPRSVTFRRAKRMDKKGLEVLPGDPSGYVGWPGSEE